MHNMKKQQRNQCAKKQILCTCLTLGYTGVVALALWYIVYIAAETNLYFYEKFMIACVTMFTVFLVECGADWLQACIKKAV